MQLSSSLYRHELQKPIRQVIYATAHRDIHYMYYVDVELIVSHKFVLFLKLFRYCGLQNYPQLPEIAGFRNNPTSHIMHHIAHTISITKWPSCAILRPSCFWPPTSVGRVDSTVYINGSMSIYMHHIALILSANLPRSILSGLEESAVNAPHRSRVYCPIPIQIHIPMPDGQSDSKFGYHRFVFRSGSGSGGQNYSIF